MSSLLELEADRAQLVREEPAARVVLFVTKRSRCPAARRARTASGAPGTASPETCRTPSMSRRIAAIATRVYSGAQPAGDPARGDRPALLALERAGAASTRRRPRRGSRPSSRSKHPRRCRSAQKRRLHRKAGPVVRAVAQDERSRHRNRELALERLAAAIRARARRRAQAPPDEAHGRSSRAAHRGKKRRGRTKKLRRPPAGE